MGKKRSGIPFAQFVIVIVITIAVFIAAVDLGRKALVYYHLRQEEARLRQEIESEKAQQQELKELKLYAQSDEFVEQWARVDAGMAKRGETAVVPVFVSGTTLMPSLEDEGE